MLPGETTTRFEAGICDRCCESSATIGLCTESDSFGDEITPVCDDCLKASQKDTNHGKCGCGVAAELKPTRDPEEGAHGPVYWLCENCRTRKERVWQREYEKEFEELY